MSWKTFWVAVACLALGALPLAAEDAQGEEAAEQDDDTTTVVVDDEGLSDPETDFILTWEGVPLGQEQQEVGQRRKSPVAAGLLSVLVPGLGHYYAGRTLQGVIHNVVWIGAGAMMGFGFGEYLPGLGITGAVLEIGNYVFAAVHAIVVTVRTRP